MRNPGISQWFTALLILCVGVLVVGTDVTSQNGSRYNKHVVGEDMYEIGFYQSIGLQNSGKPLYSKHSKYQQIDVYQTSHYGKILVLDNVVQLTERDADAYNEMMSHISMMEHANPSKVLVVGGGDGYIVSEVLKHESVAQVDHVDLDGDVVEVCKEYFPDLGKRAWKEVERGADGLVNLRIGDGAKFVRDEATAEFYDVIIQDSSDAETWDAEGNVITLPSSVLYSSKYFSDVYRILGPAGVFIFVADTFNIPSCVDDIRKWRRDLINAGFLSCSYGSITISSYATGQIGFLMCRKSEHDLISHKKLVQNRYDRMVERGLETSYYHPKLQESCFDLPLWVQKSIYVSDDESNFLSESNKEEL